MTSSFGVAVLSVISALTILSASSHSIYDLSKFKRHNQGKAARPIEANYTATGTTYLLNNMTIYETVDQTATRILIAGYDAFGLLDNVKQVSDKLADGFGFKVVIPDYFRGGAYNQTTWDGSVREDTLAVINHYRTTQNITKFGVFGFCWGGYFATQAAKNIPEDIMAAVLVHPSLVTFDDAEGVQVPMYLLPSRGEANMLPFYMVLQQKFGANSGHRRFDDMAHGFAGNSANFSDPLVRIRVDEVIDITGNFFDRIVA